MNNYISGLINGNFGTKGIFSAGQTLRERLKPLLYALVLPAYLLLFFWVEKAVPTEGYWVSYLPIDDSIPFLEGFAVFYFVWYAMLGTLGLHLLFFNADGFRRYMIYIGISFSVAMLFCLFFPNGQDLRPDLEALGRDNIFIRMMAAIYAADTNTNVLPSVHVIGAFAVLFGAWNDPAVRSLRWAISVTAVLTILVSLSTVFVKQHSLLDALVAIPYCFLCYFLVYGLRRKGSISMRADREKDKKWNKEP